MNKKFTIKGRRWLFNPDANAPFKISRSQIEAFMDCPRCFYLNHCRGIKRPDGLPFTLNNVVDVMLKKEFDTHRMAGTTHPIMAEHALNAVPFQHEMMDEWRENFKGMTWLDPRTNLRIAGAIDDVWQDRSSGKLMVVDYKATGSSSEVTLDHTVKGKEWVVGYKQQMDIYIWLLRKQGLEVDDRGFFLYAQGRRDGKGFNRKIEFDMFLLPYVASCDWIEPVLSQIKDCLMQPSLPAVTDDCEYCGYVTASLS